MKPIVLCIIVVLLSLSFQSYANELPGSLELNYLDSLHSAQSKQFDWTFSGIVSNENDEHYSYFFRFNRTEKTIKAQAVLIDMQNKNLLFNEENQVEVDNSDVARWQIGSLFLRFNSITNSWIIGLKNKKKEGFNFKIDNLGTSNKLPAIAHSLRKDVLFQINQTGLLNGHFKLNQNDKEQFVTSKKSWFQQVWVSKPQNDRHNAHNILCSFINNQALYSINLPEEDALRGALAGWRDESGAAQSISQFITTDVKDSRWNIHLATPKLQLSLQNILDNSSKNKDVVVGITQQLPGVCWMSELVI